MTTSDWPAPLVDLDKLARDESEQVEWKENVADEDDVVEAIAAFANDYPYLGGGYVVCGAAERKDEHGFPRVEYIGLDANRLREVEGKVLQRCRDEVTPSIAPLRELIPVAEGARRILVFIVPRSPYVHEHRTKRRGTITPIRVGRSTVQARNGLRRDLLVRKGELPPWDRRRSGVGVDELDLLAIRQTLVRLGRRELAQRVDELVSEVHQLHALVPPLCERDPLTGQLRPRNFAILLFGRNVPRDIPGAHVIYSLYPGRDRGEAHAERLALTGTLIEQADKMLALLRQEAERISIDKSDVEEPNVAKYPELALREAFINALAHRDYEQDHPIRVTLFADRVEIVSPGGLLFGVDPDRLRAGSQPAKWRNQSLAWFFGELQYAQGEGQGISTILNKMREHGCPPPRFEIEADSMTCILPAHPRHAWIRELNLGRSELALGQVEAARQRALALLDKDPLNAIGVELLADVTRTAREPELVRAYATRNADLLGRISAGALLALAAALQEFGAPGDHALVRRLLRLASESRLAVAEFRHLVVALRRAGDDQGAIEQLDRAFAEHPELREQPALLDLRAKSAMELGKRCRDTLRKRGISRAVRDEAWVLLQRYLRSAREDLESARARARHDPYVAEWIQRDQEYLDRLVRQASFLAPSSKPRGG